MQQRTGESRITHLRLRIEQIGSVAAICAVLLAGCVLRPSGMPLGGTQPLVKIGLAASFEGLGRHLGYEALSGVKLALAERNADGGVGGYKIELVALNDYGEPDEARLQAQEFTADQAILGVVTGWTNETARASLPVYRELGLAVTVPWSVRPELADRDSGIVLVAADLEQTAQVLVQAVANTRPSRLVVVGDALSAAPYAESSGALGLQAQIIPPPSALDSEVTEKWAGRLVLSRVQPPDAVIFATDGALAGEMLLALIKLNWAGAAFGGVEAGSVNLVNVAGHKATGLAFVSPAPAGKDAFHLGDGAVLDKDKLGPRAVLAYDATCVLLDAIELAIREYGYPSRQGVMAALPRVSRHGLTGDIGFDTAGHRRDAPVWLYMIHQDYPGRVLLLPQAASGHK